MARTLTALARTQLGLFTRAQAHARGLSYPTIRRRVESREWEEIEPHVFRVTAAPPLTWRQRLMALSLATDGIASGRAAGALFGLVPEGPLEVAVSRGHAGRRHRRPEVRIVADLSGADVTRVGGVPCTKPARTLVDLGGILPPDQFEEAVDRALVTGVVNRQRLESCATRLLTPRRPGCAAVLRILESRHPDLERARNEWEALVLRLCRRYGLPDPIPNYRVWVGGQWRELDAAFPDQRVVLEFDGFVPHSARRVFDDDRVRQNDLVDEGWKPFRFTTTALKRAPARAFAPVVRAVKRGQK